VLCRIRSRRRLDLKCLDLQIIKFFLHNFWSDEDSCLLPWNCVWNFGDSLQNLFEIVIVVIVWVLSPPSVTSCDSTLHKVLSIYLPAVPLSIYLPAVPYECGAIYRRDITALPYHSFAVCESRQCVFATHTHTHTHTLTHIDTHRYTQTQTQTQTEQQEWYRRREQSSLMPLAHAKV